MCVIIIKQKSNRISMQAMKNASVINPHGLGVVWLDTFKTEYFESSEYNVLATNRPFIAHFRYATIGAITKANMHPFVCGHKTDELLMMNGTASGYGTTNATDTQDLAEELGTIPRHKWSEHLKIKDVNAPHYCRFVSINTRTKSFQIYNRHLFTYRDGVWYSKDNIFRDNVVAVYGTLRYGCNNYQAYLKGKSIYVGEGTTQDKHPLVVSGLPYLSPIKGVGHNVVVDVFKVDDNTFADLDRLESHPNWYVREKTNIVMDDGSVMSAWVYFNDINIRGHHLHQEYTQNVSPTLFSDIL